MQLSPAEVGAGIAIVGAAGGFLRHYAPSIVKLGKYVVKTNVNGNGNGNGHGNGGQSASVLSDMTKAEHDELCALKMKLLAAEIRGPIDTRLAAIETHEASSTAFLRDVNAKVDELLRRPK